MEWEPIQTAPLDGTMVDLWCKRNWNPPETHQRVCNAFWDEWHKCWRGSALHFVDRIDEARERGLTPTHWMKIVEGPK